MSYKAAWGKIKASEKYLNARIVNTDRKKGAWLTDEGRELLGRYRELKTRCLDQDNEIFETLFHMKEE